MPNKLQHETSAYLLQHAENPVNWYPWNNKALSLAKQQDKPILLSIGYSACHWCHVMAHESFEDEATAQLMNSGFINIKADKEERPDLDKIYQTAHQVINQRPGGWPLTVILDPHTLLPFFAGTYFPKEARFGLLAFKDILQQIIDFYQQEKPKLQEHQHQMRGVFARLSAEQTDNAAPLSAAPLAAATQQLLQLHDKHNGGFGKQPKFPQPSYLQRLLKYSFYDLTQQKNCLPALYITLNKMALGGLYDHLGGGFFRYSVDAAWQIPHFEKMLYDNAQLLAIYSDAYAIHNNPLLAHHIQQTAEWVINEMQAPFGGYYATLDADSEGQEGKFYVWDAAEVSKLLSAEEYTVFSETFGLNQRPNFENHWHLRVLQLNTYPPKEGSVLASACSKLLQARTQRVKPHCDEKIITGWNGLMVKGMAKAGLMLQNPRYIESARLAVDFIYKNLWKDGRLFSTYQQNAARFNGYLDDYAYLLDGVLTLLSVQWSSTHLQFAIELAEALIKHFWDEMYHGFFFTSHDHETLIYRPKPLTDEAIPSGNGVAAHALLKLSYLLSEPRYLTIAEQTLMYAMPSIAHLPYLHSTLLDTLEDFLHSPKLAIIRGADAELFSWHAALKAHVSSHEWIYAIPNDAENLPAALKEKKTAKQAVVYICEGMQCSAPIQDVKELVNN